jgi:hypothetical protein
VKVSSPHPIYPGYKKAEAKYIKLCEEKSHTLSRTELAHCNRELYYKIKSWENEGKIVPFVPGEPFYFGHIKGAGRIRGLVKEIDDTAQNKSRAYNQFVSQIKRDKKEGTNAVKKYPQYLF